ncbi:hypothetical protein ACLBWH_01245 [Sphingomonas sp. M6A6_1c]
MAITVPVSVTAGLLALAIAAPGLTVMVPAFCCAVSGFGVVASHTAVLAAVVTHRANAGAAGSRLADARPIAEAVSKRVRVRAVFIMICPSSARLGSIRCSFQMVG